ncbi:helix-turn-helix domain-containing protein [Actinoplanes sp. M2I2]|uniref:helix-turn-helix domain-containing protein n=1 Tax=Actinoplanes sp. M2I2 TaxID=1734444 RepID=UPI0020217813|nr:helix-turn-helix domain-containing protein [Actinoplanes sp. M2I2]
MATFAGAGLVLVGLLLTGKWLVDRRLRERYMRAAPWEPTPRDGCLVVLPGRVDGAQHRPRERGTCDCLVAGVLPDGTRLMLGVSPSAFHAWDSSGRSAGAVPLGRLRSIMLIQRAYGILTLRGSQYIVDVDNQSMPEGRHHRLRIMFTDQSYAEVAVRAHQDVRRFVEIFDRIHDDLQLRVLGGLTPGTPENLTVLAGTLAVTPDTLTRRLRLMTAAGLVQRPSKKTVVITEAGVRALAEQTRYIADWSRVIVPRV